MSTKILKFFKYILPKDLRMPVPCWQIQFKIEIVVPRGQAEGTPRRWEGAPPGRWSPERRDPRKEDPRKEVPRKEVPPKGGSRVRPPRKGEVRNRRSETPP